MNSLGLSVLPLCVLASLCVATNSDRAYADTAFKTGYDRYYKKNVAPITPAQQELNGKKTSCFTCHEKGRKGKDAKTYKIPYGIELGKLLEKGDEEGEEFDRKKFSKLLKAEFRVNKNPNKPGKAEEKLQQVFVAVEKLKASNGKTYGENFANGIPPEELTEAVTTRLNELTVGAPPVASEQ